jgi:hypothetical protein
VHVENEELKSTMLRSPFDFQDEELLSARSTPKMGSDRSSESSTMPSSCASSLVTEEGEELEDLDFKDSTIMQDLHLLEDQDMMRTTHDESDDCSSITSSRPKHVRFGSAQARVYPQVLGDHPYCAEGCSLELDWEFTCQEECPAEAGGTYQKLCPRLTPEERLAIIQPKYTDQCIRQACRRRSAQDGIVGKRQQRRLQEQFFGTACK